MIELGMSLRNRLVYQVILIIALMLNIIMRSLRPLIIFVPHIMITMVFY